MDMTKPRELGDFGNQMMIAPYVVTADAIHPTATIFGLQNSATILWATFADEDGDNYCVCREFPAYMSGGCWAMSNAGRNGMLLMPGSAGLWGGGLAIQRDGNRIEWLSVDSYRSDTPALHLLYDDGKITYRERDFIVIEADSGSLGYQFYEPTHGQASTNQVFEASGTINGKRVKGWLGINVHFQLPGVNYRISPMIPGGQLITWIDVGNVFSDGSSEAGPIMVGLDGFSVAWIVDDKGNSSFSYDVRAEFDRDSEGFATEMRFSYFDARTGRPMKWIWRPKPGSNMTELPAVAPHLKYKRSAEGICMREGETRTLVQSSGWPEFQIDGRIEKFLADQEEGSKRDLQAVAALSVADEQVGERI